MISIIIPVYKNYDLFFENFRKNMNYFDGCEVIVMNDYPGEKIAQEVSRISSNTLVIDNEKNLGFGSNANAGVKKSRGEFIFLVNSDVILKDDSFKKSVAEFKKDKHLFALSFAQIESNGKLVGSNRGYFRDGLINHSRALHSSLLTPQANFWAEGGSSIFRRDLFLKLDGFDPLYNPFYWEDIDLSYRAWKMGYKILYYPRVKVQHYHESTIGKYFQKSAILERVYRNQFIFNWKNLSDKDLQVKQLIYIPILLLRSIVDGNWTLLKGFFLALTKILKIFATRKKIVKLFVKADKEILNKFNA